MAHDRSNGRQQDGLIEGLLRSDVGTIRALYDRHFPAVKRFVQLNSGTERDAQDGSDSPSDASADTAVDTAAETAPETTDA